MKEYDFHSYRRFRFIDMIVDCYGFITMRLVRDYFGVSDRYASEILRKYMEEEPGNIVYNFQEKRYQKTPFFRRAFT